VSCRWHWLKHLGLPACLALCGCTHVDVRLDHFMTPDRGPRTARLASGYVVENIVVAYERESVGATYAHHPDSKAIIFFCGGDRFHRSLEGGAALEALALDADVVLFDYPGYGETTGAPSIDSILDSAIAVYDSIFSREGTHHKKRVLYGFSLGGMVAAQLAQERRADGVVLEATPPSVRAWADSRIPVVLKPTMRLRIEPQLAHVDAVAALERFRGKLLLLASPADDIVPARLSIDMEGQLRRAGRDITLVQFADRDHGSIHRASAFPAMLRNFVEQVRPLP
jgi:uncharacterized protein